MIKTDVEILFGKRYFLPAVNGLLRDCACERV